MCHQTTNIEKFKQQITAENLCDFLFCTKCPFNDFDVTIDECKAKLAKWANGVAK